MRPLWLLAVAVSGIVACREARPAPPAHVDKIVFSHDFHAKLSFDCATCHGGANELPKMATCATCHQAHLDANECAFCHTDPTHPMTYEARVTEVDFDHAKHLAPVAACASCHPTLWESDRPPPPRPTMASCTSCHRHEQDYAQLRCQPCHKDLTRFPIEPVATFSHQGRFLGEHAVIARTGAATCAQCHDQTFCADCHARTVATRIEVRFPEAVDRAFVHRGDYLARHTIEAKADPASCNRCHGTSFCASCHTLQALTNEIPNPRNPHAAGWSTPGNAQFHGDAARRNINACASCHDQGAASMCVTCHKVGGIGGDPHPPAWTQHHSHAEIQRSSMCLTCHR